MEAIIMSAYIVDKKTIDRIVSGMLQLKLNHEMGDIDIIDNNDLGQKLWDMNAAAVDQRYEETNTKQTYTFNSVDVSIIQAFKSLRCFMYQCSEGDIPDTDLYKQMDIISDRMSNNIVYDLPAFDAAEWE